MQGFRVVSSHHALVNPGFSQFNQATSFKNATQQNAVLRFNCLHKYFCINVCSTKPRLNQEVFRNHYFGTSANYKFL